MDRLQCALWDVLCNLSGEEVARAFTNFYGNQLLDVNFYEFMVDEGYMEDEIGVLSPDADD